MSDFFQLYLEGNRYLTFFMQLGYTYKGYTFRQKQLPSERKGFALQSAYSANIQQHMMHIEKDATVHFIWQQSKSLLLQ